MTIQSLRCLINKLEVLFLSNIFSIEVIMAAHVRAGAVHVGRKTLSAFVSGVGGTSNERLRIIVLLP